MVEQGEEKRKKLGEILRSLGIISDQQLQKALDFQKDEGGLIGEAFVKLGFTGEIDIVQALATQYGFPYMPIENYELKNEMSEVIPENIARQHGMVPIDVIGDIITVAMSNPLNYKAIEDVEAMTKKKVQVFISTVTGVNGVLNKLYKKN